MNKQSLVIVFHVDFETLLYENISYREYFKTLLVTIKVEILLAAKVTSHCQRALSQPLVDRLQHR
jgi:hypothetical protein